MNYHYGKKLKEFLKEKGIKAQDLAQLLDCSAQSIYNYYKQDSFTRVQIATLCHTLPIDPDFFGEEISLFKKLKVEIEDTSTFLSYERKRNQLLDGSDKYQDFLNTYFELIIDKIKKSKKSITVLDYLNDNWIIEQRIDKDKFRNQDKEKTTFYAEKYREYLKIINKTIKSRKGYGIKYKRIFQRPLTITYSGSKSPNGLHLIMDLLLDSMIDHLNIMLNLNKEELEVEFYWINIPIRVSSYMIIDDETIITEYLKFNKHQKHIPDMLFIESINNDHSGKITEQFIDSHTSQLKVITSKAERITKEKMMKTLDELIMFFQEEKMELCKIFDSQNEVSQKFEKPNYYQIACTEKLRGKLEAIDKKIIYTQKKISYLS